MLYLTETELAEAKQMAEQNQSKSKFLEWILQQHAMGEKINARGTTVFFV